MPALSQTLISILEGGLRAGATRAEISATAGEVRILRGDDVLGHGALPADAFAPLAAELRALGAREGARFDVTVRSPVGPLPLSVEMDGPTLRIFFPRDAAEAEAEAAFSELMGQLSALNTDRVECARGQASFLRGRELVAVAPLVEEAMALLVAHGRALLGPGEQSGNAVLLSSTGASRTFQVELSEAGVAFTLETARDAKRA